MKAVIAKQELLKKVTDVASVAGRNETMPILSHLLLQADGATSHVLATDLSEAIFEPIALRASVPGSVCVPAKKLLDIIKELEGDIAIETSEDVGMVTVKAGKSVFRLACMGTAEFPHTKGLTGFEMPGPVFASAVERTIYAVGVADTRYVLNGLLLDLIGAQQTVHGAGRRCRNPFCCDTVVIVRPPLRSSAAPHRQ